MSQEYRPSWDEFWMIQALFYSTRSTCDRLRTACLIVGPDNRLRSAGYVGSVAGTSHCDEVGHFMVDSHCLRTIHAEDNAIAYRGQEDFEGATVYLVTSPCVICAKHLMNVGVKRIVYAQEFGNVHGKDKGWEFIHDLAKQKNISFEKLPIDFHTVVDSMLHLLEGPGGALRSPDSGSSET